MSDKYYKYACIYSFVIYKDCPRGLSSEGAATIHNHYETLYASTS